MTATINRCTSADLAALRTMSIKTFNDTFADQNTAANMQAYFDEALNPEQLRQEFETPGTTFYFIQAENGDKAGYLKVNTGTAQTDEMGPNAFQVERIYIDQDYQHQGLGGQLLKFAFDLAAKEKAQKIWLGVWEHNQNAIGFYHKMGFHQVGSHDFNLGTDRQTDLLMEKSLV